MLNCHTSHLIVHYQSCTFKISNLKKWVCFGLYHFDFALDNFVKARCSWEPLLDGSFHQVPTFRSSKVVSSQGGARWKRKMPRPMRPAVSWMLGAESFRQSLKADYRWGSPVHLVFQGGWSSMKSSFSSNTFQIQPQNLKSSQIPPNIQHPDLAKHKFKSP